MATTNTATATPRTIKLNEIVAMKDGTSVRVVRIKGGHVYVNDPRYPVNAGIPGWLYGFTMLTMQEFANRVAR